MDIGLISTVVAAIAAVAALIVAVYAIVATFRIANRQEKVEREIANKQEEQERERTKRQEIRELTDKLSQHLTSWFHELRDVVNANNSQRLERMREDLEYFMGGVRYEVPLRPIESDLERYPECVYVVMKGKEFKEKVLDFKTGAIVTLSRMIESQHDWSVKAYNMGKEEELDNVRRTYEDVITAIDYVRKQL